MKRTKLAWVLAIWLVSGIPWFSTAAASAGPQDEADEAAGEEAGEEQRSSEERKAAKFGGPDQVDRQLASDAETEKTFLDGYFEWKTDVAERRGLRPMIDHQTQAQRL